MNYQECSNYLLFVTIFFLNTKKTVNKKMLLKDILDLYND